MSRCPLVMIEWQDSAQPVAEWSYLAGWDAPSVVNCVSVGWLIHDGEVKALAPNMGDLGSENAQVSGVIRIPACCITRMVELDEPDLTSPSSRPAKARKRRGAWRRGP